MLIRVLACFALLAPGCESEPVSAPTNEAPAGDVATDAPTATETAEPKQDSVLASATAPTEIEVEPARADDPEEAIEEPEEEPAPPPAEPITMLLIGDSMAATGFGVLLEKNLDAHPNVTCHRKGKSSTGLARPDFFDWMGESRRQISAKKPDVVIAIMGGNDGQDLTPKTKKAGRRVQWKSENWEAAYRKRVDDLLDQLTQEGRRVVWMALPKMGMRSLERKLVLIRRIQREAVDARDNVMLVETTPFLVDANGVLNKRGHVRGKQRDLRADDGIHFTMAGSEYLADRVAPEILNVLGIPPVEPEPAEGTKAATKNP